MDDDDNDDDVAVVVSSICFRIVPTRFSMSFLFPEPSMIVVFSLSTTILFATPRSVSATFSNFKPNSSAITFPPALSMAPVPQVRPSPATTSHRPRRPPVPLPPARSR